MTLKGIIASPRLIKTSESKNLNVTSLWDADDIKYIQQLACNKFLNIGINWQASPNPNLDKGRSFKLKYFNDISLINKIRLYSLQKVNGLDQINEINKQFKLNIPSDFDKDAPFVDTAAIIENLDLVITCDTSIAHLSGAIGKKTFLLLQKNSEWRWLHTGDYSPWYDSIKIYRQKKQDDWESVFKDVKDDIIKTLGIS